ncbi:MAG: hypothetical protein HDR44_01175 [Allobaculum sp.]|nr:hypothetical protein [Allobaculum sp.]MDE6079764.1 hypothetical protein [Duncaniella sp.]
MAILYPQIFDAVKAVTGISQRKLVSRSRLWPVVEARQLFVLLASRLGAIDSSIGFVLMRGRVGICKTRHVAENYISVSRLFARKYERVKKHYDDAAARLG